MALNARLLTGVVFGKAMRRLAAVTFSLALMVTVGGWAAGAVPPRFAVQQQERAVRAYCTEWRRAHGRLDAEQLNRRVLARLEREYPNIFPDCRPAGHGRCVSWLNAMIEGLRAYGRRSLRSVCAAYGDEAEFSGM